MEKKNGRIVYWTLLGNGKWNMYIAATKDGLCYVGSQNGQYEELATWVRKRLPSHETVADNEAMEPYATELLEFLEGRRKEFTLEMDLRGTPFQLAVWNVVGEIPYGETVSYTDIAERIGKPGSVRAVSTAIGANPILMTIPCHRVIAKDGKLAGYRGGVDMKERLLGLEN